MIRTGSLYFFRRPLNGLLLELPPIPAMNHWAIVSHPDSGLSRVHFEVSRRWEQSKVNLVGARSIA